MPLKRFFRGSGIPGMENHVYLLYLCRLHQLTEHLNDLFLGRLTRISRIAGIVQGICSKLIEILLADTVILLGDPDILVLSAF